jgi:hypothetical protein
MLETEALGRLIATGASNNADEIMPGKAGAAKSGK